VELIRGGLQYTRIKIPRDDSRNAKAVEIAQVAFIVPYLILLVWVTNGENQFAALIVAVLLMLANVAAYAIA